MIGGQDGSTYLNSTETYDEGTGTWTPAGNLSTGRDYPAATVLQDGRVLVAGGRNSGGAVATAEIFDSTRNTWSPTGSMSVGTI